MQFAQPENLWSLLILVPMLGVYLFWWHWKKRVAERIGDRELVGAMATARSARRQVARAVFILLGTALLCIAFAQPQWGQTNRPIKRTGVDVVFALDLSSSMSARDVAPNRLEAAKNEIESALEVLRGDRVGLVVFTAVSFVQSPLTTDFGAIRFYLDRLKPGQMPLGGTSLGRAVVDSVELLTGERLAESSEDGVEMRRAKNQVVVLITDGEDHESDPRSAAQLANGNDIKIVTVGFGSAEGERIPVLRPDGTLAGYKRDRDGAVVRTRLDSKTLQEMSAATGGEYIQYDGENSVANALVSYINELEKTEIETMLKERYRERYMFFALPGLLLLLLSLLLGERKRRPKRKSTAQLIAFIFALSLSGSGCERAFEDTLSAVDRGNDHIESGEFSEALAEYRAAEKQIPARPELHHDIGRALLGLERFTEAADAFARALETHDPSLRFDAMVNLGLAHAGNEDWQQAWETFRDALLLAARNTDVIDDDRVAEARRNLEVAWRKFYPPCAQLEDEHEENDDAASATRLEEPSIEDATLCGLDDDHFVVGAIPGTRVSVTATFRDLRDDPHEPRPFLPRPADLQIALFDQTGEEVLVVDQGEPDEVTTGRNATRTIDRFLVEEGMVTTDDPHVVVKVGAAENLEYEYDLKIESIPPCHALEEEYEDNDTPEEAKVVPPGNHTMHHCPDDEDWFAIDAQLGDSVFFDVQRGPDAERERPAELDLELYDADGRVVATGEHEGAYLTVGARDVTEPGRYLLRVAGSTDDEQGPYELDVYRYAPCIVGDDRFEENDTAHAASLLDSTQPVHRYLRACDGDPDFYRIDFPEDKPQDERKVEVGLSRISTPPPGYDPTELPAFEFDLVSPSGDQILVPGREPLVAPDAEQRPNPPIELLVETDDVEGDSAFLRAAGENEFYHLIQLDVQKQQQEQDDEEQQDDGGDEDPSDSEDTEDSDSGEDDDDANEEQEGDDTEEGEEGEDEQEPQPEPEDEGEPEPHEESQQATEEEAAEGRVEDVLEALEQTDDNFQMKKALENMPGRYIEKDW